MAPALDAQDLLAETLGGSDLLMPTATRSEARDIAERVHTDPVWFSETILGHDIWSTPAAILRAIAQPRARVAVKSCHASSKTFTGAEVVLWAPLAGGIAITTAPTDRQVRRLIWTEVNAMHPKSKYPLGGRLLQKEYAVAPDCYSLGLATDKGVNFQGFHARDGGFMVVVIDEGPGVEPAVLNAIEGIRAGGDVRVMLLGNPDIPSGPFFDAFGEKGLGWSQFSIDGFETPNLEDEDRPGFFLGEFDQSTETVHSECTRCGAKEQVVEARDGLCEDCNRIITLLSLPEHRLEYSPRPYLITRRFIREKYDEWGEQSPLWASKIRGRFPDQSEDSLLSLSWLEAAARSELEPSDDDPLEAGIDVAGPGEDETFGTIRKGPKIIKQKGWANADARGDVLDFLRPWQDQLGEDSVKVDSVGQGYFFARHLEDNGFKGKIADVNVGESAEDKERYANLKAELYWGLRLRAQEHQLSGLTDSKTKSQLASIRYKHNARGQVVIESKDDAKKRGIKSPDAAESVMLAFAKVKVRRWGVL